MREGRICDAPGCRACEQLRSAAVELATKRGVRAITNRALARRARLSPDEAMRHYASVDACLAAAYREGFELMVDACTPALSGDGSWQDRLRGRLRGDDRRLRRPPAAGAVLHGRGMADQPAAAQPGAHARARALGRAARRPPALGGGRGNRGRAAGPALRAVRRSDAPRDRPGASGPGLQRALDPDPLRRARRHVRADAGVDARPSASGAPGARSRSRTRRARAPGTAGARRACPRAGRPSPGRRPSRA